MQDQFKLPGDWRTFRQASEELGMDYNKLRQYVYYHQIPFQRLGTQCLVKLSDLEAYGLQSRKRLQPA